MILPRTYNAALHHLRPSLIRHGYHSKPAFLILGAQKAGTTALYYYLAEHPNLVPSKEKEIGFFTPELFDDWPQHPNHRFLSSQRGSDFFDSRTYPKMAAWYHSQFPLPHELGPHCLTYEATPEYLYHSKAAERIFKYDQNMKLIAILRDPVERALSAWSMYSNFGEGDYRPLTYAPRRETREFEEAIHAEIREFDTCRIWSDPGYVRRGLYYKQLLRYFQLFERDQILFLDSRTLRNDTSRVMKQVICFLELPEYAFQNKWQPIHVGKKKTQVSTSTLSLLREYYKPHNELLYQLLDFDFGW
jgi:hypothetical protein